MKNALIIAANLVALGAIVCACILALHGISGWGWFLFIAACFVIVSK